MPKESPKTRSYKLNTINGIDIYLDPADGLFFFTLPDSRERVTFATMRAAEEQAARGDQPPIKVIVAGYHNEYPKIVDVIGMSGWNLVTTDYKEVNIQRTYLFNEELYNRLFLAAAHVADAQHAWKLALDELESSGLAVRDNIIDGLDEIRSAD